MTKILSQAGISLADVYNVEGSIAGVDQLISEEVHVSHEMGGTIFSERFAGSIRRGVTGDIAQNTTFAVGFNDLPVTPTRIHGLMVLVDTVARVSIAAVMAQSVVQAREFPIWVFDDNNTDTIRFFENGVEATQNVLRGRETYSLLPSILATLNQQQAVGGLVLRGNTSAFGAGTVELTLLAFLSFAAQEGLSSAGLPIPSW